MGFDFKDLDDATRKEMAAEIDFDVKAGKLYLSKYFKEGVGPQYEQLLRQAAAKHNEAWLADEIRGAGLMRANTHAKHPKKDEMIEKDVPITAAETLAEGEFNRFYARALCKRAIAAKKQLEIYRAKEVMNARSESQAMIGKRFDPQALLDDLRTSQGMDTALKLPSGPNSGLSVRLP
jgi:hypothetical protein